VAWALSFDGVLIVVVAPHLMIPCGEAQRRACVGGRVMLVGVRMLGREGEGRSVTVTDQ
jgi:hypothetical protein